MDLLPQLGTYVGCALKTRRRQDRSISSALAGKRTCIKLLSCAALPRLRTRIDTRHDSFKRST